MVLTSTSVYYMINYIDHNIVFIDSPIDHIHIFRLSDFLKYPVIREVVCKFPIALGKLSLPQKIKFFLNKHRGPHFWALLNFRGEARASRTLPCSVYTRPDGPTANYLFFFPTG